MLQANKIQENWKEFRQRINELFPDRSAQLNQMYDELEERSILAPASSFDYFHNAFPGGYIDHVLRVHDNAILHHKMWTALWKKEGLELQYTEEEMHFAALHHDLGKLGLPGYDHEHYVPNDSKWHRENQGKMYKTNRLVPKMSTADNSFYLLNHYRIRYSINEMIGIKLTDGLYDESNGEYLKGFSLESKLRTQLPYILHHADITAFRLEFDRWNKQNCKLPVHETFFHNVTRVADLPKNAKSTFDGALFTDLFAKESK